MARIRGLIVDFEEIQVEERTARGTRGACNVSHVTVGVKIDESSESALILGMSCSSSGAPCHARQKMNVTIAIEKRKEEGEPDCFCTPAEKQRIIKGKD